MRISGWHSLRRRGVGAVLGVLLSVAGGALPLSGSPAAASTIDAGGGCAAASGYSVPSVGYLYLKVTFTCNTYQNIGSGFTVIRSGKVVDTGPYKDCGVVTKCTWTSRKQTDPAGTQKWEIIAEWTTATGVVGGGTPEVNHKTVLTEYH